MRDPLRQIAVSVRESKPGGFAWVLIENVGGPTRWVELEASDKRYKSYSDAMADGLIALQEMVDDLDVGPRAAAVKDGPEAKEEPAPAESRKSGPFGFGTLQ